MGEGIIRSCTAYQLARRGGYYHSPGEGRSCCHSLWMKVMQRLCFSPPSQTAVVVVVPIIVFLPERTISDTSYLTTEKLPPIDPYLPSITWKKLKNLSNDYRAIVKHKTKPNCDIAKRKDFTEELDSLFDISDKNANMWWVKRFYKHVSFNEILNYFNLCSFWTITLKILTCIGLKANFC